MTQGIRRLVTVLCLLAGVLAMHVFSGGVAHDSAAMSGMPSASHVVGAGSTAPASDGSVEDAALAVVAPTVSFLGPGGHVMAGVLCLLILLPVATWLFAPRGALARGSRVPLLVPGRRRSRAPSRGPPRDLLAQLCVLRT